MKYYIILILHNSKKKRKEKNKPLFSAITGQLAHNVEKIRTAHKNT